MENLTIPITMINKILPLAQQELSKYTTYELFYDKEFYGSIKGNIDISLELNLPQTFLPKNYFEEIFKKYSSLCYILLELLPLVSEISIELENLATKDDGLLNFYKFHASITKVVTNINYVSATFDSIYNSLVFKRKNIYNMLYNKLKYTKIETITKEGLNLHLDIFRLDSGITKLEQIKGTVNALKNSIDNCYYTLKDILYLKGIELKTIPM
jgi:hypothetical protein